MITPADAVERIGARFGVHAGSRALHARGVICSGSFRPSPEAAGLTRAAHMQAEVPVLARLSNGSGDPNVPDRAPDVRGLAVSFELPDGNRTDIVAQSAPRFPVRTPDAFIDLIEATERSPAMLWKLPLFLARNPSALPALRANAAALRAPASYGDVSYYAVHAFRWSDDVSGSRWVRYVWTPGSAHADPTPEQSERDYLRRELKDRLSEQPVSFDLELQVGAADDDPHDPTSVWSGDGSRIVAGLLRLDAVADGRDGIIFDPMRLTDGIEPSDDAILHFRPRAYAASYDRRTGVEHERPSWAR